MILVRLISHLPLGVLYLVSDAFCLLIYNIIGYRKKVVRENLQHAFPKKSEKERLAIEKKFYRNFTDSLAETIKLLTMPNEMIAKRFTLLNAGVVTERVKNGEIVVGMCGHFFNWEGHLLSYTGNVDNRCETIYMKVNSTFFERLMKTIRSRNGGDLTDRGAFQRKYLRNRNNNRLIVLAADQRPNYLDLRYWTEFMNRETAFYEGAEKLAKKFNHSVVYAEVSKPKRGHYEFKYQLLATPPYVGSPPHSITDAFIELVERNIEKQPSLYLWSHKRWKIKKPLQPYDGAPTAKP